MTDDQVSSEFTLRLGFTFLTSNQDYELHAQTCMTVDLALCNQVHKQYIVMPAMRYDCDDPLKYFDMVKQYLRLSGTFNPLVHAQLFQIRPEIQLFYRL